MRRLPLPSWRFSAISTSIATVAPSSLYSYAESPLTDSEFVRLNVRRGACPDHRNGLLNVALRCTPVSRYNDVASRLLAVVHGRFIAKL